MKKVEYEFFNLIKKIYNFILNRLKTIKIYILPYN